MSDMQQDELAELFTQTLNLHQRQLPTPAPSPTSTEQQQRPMTYASAHYHHSSHLASQSRAQSELAAPHLSLPQDLQFPEFETILLRNSIDPTSLSPSQIILFQNADSDQKLRLLELWRICPPERGQTELAEQGDRWRETSIRQEEEVARARWERMEQEKAGRQEQQQKQAQQEQQRKQIREQYMDECEVDPVSMSNTHTEQRAGAEPYMVNGYGNAGWYNRSADPVYQSATGLWQSSGTIQKMENQYGAFVQRQGAGLGFYGEFVRGGEDDMVM